MGQSDLAASFDFYQTNDPWAPGGSDEHHFIRYGTNLAATVEVPVEIWEAFRSALAQQAQPAAESAPSCTNPICDCEEAVAYRKRHPDAAEPTCDCLASLSLQKGHSGGCAIRANPAVESVDVVALRERIAVAIESAQTERSGDPDISEWSRGYQNAMDKITRNLAFILEAKA